MLLGIAALIAFVVGLASRPSPIVIFSGENGEAQGIQFSWPLIVGLLVGGLTMFFYGIGGDEDYE